MDHKIDDKKFQVLEFDRDDSGLYILPLLGYSWGKPYGKNIWFGWLRWLVKINFK